MKLRSRSLALLVLPVLLLGAGCRPKTETAPPPATTTSVSPAAEEPAAGKPEPCPPVERLCFDNRSPNPVHVVYWLCGDPEGLQCQQVGDYRIEPKSSCVREGLQNDARSIRVQIGDAGWKITRPFCCPGPDSCECLRDVHVSYDGYYLNGTISLAPVSGASCSYPLGPEDPGVEPVEPPETGCNVPCAELPEKGGS